MTTAGNELDEAGRELLASVLAGEIETTHPDVLAKVGSDPVFARELEPLLRIHHELVNLESPALVATEIPAAPGLEAIAVAAMQEQMRAAPEPSAGDGSKAWPRVLLALAAALVLGGLGMWLWGRSDAPRQPRQELGARIGIHEAEDGRVLRFDSSSLLGARFDVRVVAGGTELMPWTRVPAAEWRPSPELSARWPSLVKVEVRASGGMQAEPVFGTIEWRPRR